MTDRVALVTGASGGIGRAAAVAMAADGRTVACGYHSDDAGAKETVGLIEEAGGTAAAFRADVSDEQQVAELFRAVTEWADPPVIVVASAGINRDGLTVRYPVDQFEHVMRVNVTGAFLCIRSALPAMMKTRWGRIVAVSSAAAMRGNPGQAAYSASKAAMVGMIRVLAKEYGSRGITANAVCPGFIETDMTSGLPGRARGRLLESIPTGRIGTPEEAAAAIRFLTGDDASYVTGAVLAVDGGLTA
ncbi:MAG: 3-oxoacyl-ACP reductase FabG [Actinomycetota bacterium]